jgi:hypothetical protein
MVSAAILELFQFTFDVMSAVDLSEYDPIALNCLNQGKAATLHFYSARILSPIDAGTGTKVTM